MNQVEHQESVQENVQESVQEKPLKVQLTKAQKDVVILLSSKKC